jgi:hypothetical protein
MELTTIDLALKVANFTALFIFGVMGITISVIKLSKDKN